MPSPPLAIKGLKKDELAAWISRLIANDLEDVGDMYWWEGQQMRTDLVKLLCTFYDNLRGQESVSLLQGIAHANVDG